MTRPQVCVLMQGEDLDETLADASRALARRLALPLLESAEIEPEALVLALGEKGLELRPGEAPLRRGARVDFRKRAIVRHKRSGHATRRQPLARAVGRGAAHIVDATAGFGDDTIALASLGHRVLAFERSPIVAALLEDGCERARQIPMLAEAAARIELRIGDACDLLRSLPTPPDVVYVDPMYPPRRSKSALPRLPIQLLRRLVGEEDDADALFAAAMESGARRVVVKRPPEAPSLGGTPAARFEGKLARYDVYHPR